MDWITIVLIVLIIFFITKIYEHKISKILILILFLIFIVSIFSFFKVSKTAGVDFSTTNGIITATKIYFNWLINSFQNTKNLVGYAIKMNWSSNSTNLTLKQVAN